MRIPYGLPRRLEELFRRLDLAGGLARFVFVPHPVWQVRLGRPTFEFTLKATSDKMVEVV